MERVAEEIIDFLGGPLGKHLVAASLGKLSLREISQLLPEEMDIVLYIIMLRRMLEEGEQHGV